MGIVQRQGIRNTIITYFGILVGFVSLLIVQPHFLSKEEIGLVRVLFSFSMLISTFMPVGMNSITFKYFPYFRDRDKGHYGFFGLMLLVPLAGFLLFAGITWMLRDYILSQYIGQSQLFTEYFYYVFPLTLFLTYVSVLTSYSYSIFRTSVPSFLNDIIIRIGSIVLYTLYFIHWINRDQLIFLFVAVYGIQMITLLIYIFIIDKPSLKVDLAFLRENDPQGMMKYGLLLSFASISSMGMKNIDIVFLGKYVPLKLVGIYSIAAFIPSVIEAPLMALEKIGLPKIADAWAKGNHADIREIYSRSSRYLFLAGGLLFLGINLNLISLFKLLPDAEFAKGIPVVMIISIGTLMNMATGINDSIIYTSDKYIYGTYMLIILFLAAICNNIIFIPLFSIEGAALATVLSAFIFNLMKYLFIWKNFKLQPWDRKTFLILLTILFTFAAVWFVPHLDYPVADIICRSVIITVIFVAFTMLFNIAPELQELLYKTLRIRK